MQHERKFYRCAHCGNIISFLVSSGVPVVCCGEKMQELIPGSVDAAVEKHVPAAQREGSKLTVRIASVPHPMQPEHYIMWIAVAEADRLSIVSLRPDQAAEAVFCVGEGPVTVYEYCNLHGLWETVL